MMSGRHILVFDPSDTSRAILVDLLGEWGLEVTGTGRAQEAIESCEHTRFDLVLAALSPPQLDALEVACRVKSRQEFVPVLFVDEGEEAIDWLSGYLPNRDGFARTPVVESELELQVRSLLRAKSNYDRLAGTANRVPLLPPLSDLPGLYNRRFLSERLYAAYKRATAQGLPLSTLVIDLDDFKSINSAHGFAKGDRILAGVARFVRSHLREHDTVCRFGGEEFVVVMTETEGVVAAIVAERLRQKIAEHDFSPEGDGTPVRFTASIGGAALAAPGQGPEALLEDATSALLEAKRAGKNRVVLGGR